MTGAVRAIPVGADQDPDMPLHQRTLPPFLPGGTLRPDRILADLGLFRDICALGLWDMARRMSPEILRTPTSILACQARPDMNGTGYASALVGLNQAEAAALARAAGGRLPDEGEMDWVLRHGMPEGLTGQMPKLPLWTLSAWSDWSYRLVIAIPEPPFWQAPPGRALPDNWPDAPACLFMAGPPVRRLAAKPDQTGGCVIVRDDPVMEQGWM